MPGLVEADDDGLYVVKFRGAGQGRRRCRRAARRRARPRLGLPVPEIVLVDVDPSSRAASPTPRSRSSCRRAAGSTSALDFLPGALPSPPPRRRRRSGARRRRRLARRADANVDRTPRNPNMLIWHERPVADRPRRRAVSPPRRDVARRCGPGRLPADRRPRPLALRGLDCRGRRAAGAAAAPRDAGAPSSPPCPTTGSATTRRRARVYVDLLRSSASPTAAFAAEAEEARRAVA